MRILMSLIVISFVTTLAHAEMPTEFKFVPKIDFDSSHWQFEGSNACLESARKAKNTSKFLSEKTFVCTHFEQGGQQLTTCTQPLPISGGYSVAFSQFWIGRDSRPTGEPEQRIDFEFLSGQLNSSAGTYEVRFINKQQWLNRLLTKKSPVEVPYECRIVMPAELVF